MNYSSCGLKLINGVERIGAPGFETEKVPGVTQGGMVWPHRFRIFCNQLLEEMDDEFELYQMYRKRNDKLIFEMCYNGKTKPCVRFSPTIVPRKPQEEL